MASASLNPEPSLPAERKESDLPPKTYAEATEENLDRYQISSNGDNPSAQYSFSGQGQDDTPRSPRKNMHKKNDSVRLNGHVNFKVKEKETKDQENSNLVVEDFPDRDGQHLTSLRRAETELVSGRKAGAGWERSK